MRTTTVQKERMAARRSQVPSFDSGGGDSPAFAAPEDRSRDAEGKLVGSDADDASAAIGGAMLRVFAVNFMALKDAR